MIYNLNYQHPTNFTTNSMHVIRHIKNRLIQMPRYLGILIVISCAVFSIFFVILYLSLPDVKPLAYENPSTTAFIELRGLEAKQIGSAFDLKWKWVSLNQISPYLQHAVLYSEDPTFWSNNGIDMNRIKRAIQLNWEAMEIKNGASTITQQVAKNLYLSPTQSLYRKMRELLIAFELERYLSKERILEIYLNLAEWGDGVFGAEAAANYWYQRSASDLSPLQAVSLVLALPNPSVRNPTHLSPNLKSYSNRLLLMLTRDAIMSSEEMIESLHFPEDKNKLN